MCGRHPFQVIPQALRHSSHVTDDAITLKLSELATRVPHDLSSLQDRLSEARAERYRQHFISDVQLPLEVGDICFAIEEFDREKGNVSV